MRDYDRKDDLMCGEHHRKGGFHGRIEGFHIEDASLQELLIRAGYIAERKSGRQRGQNRILRILLENPKMSQRALQERLGIEPGSMSEILAKLEEKGFLVKEKDENDRRRMILTLTEEGKAVAGAESGNGEKPDKEEIFSSLTPDEQKRLKEMLRKLLTQWRMERRQRSRAAGLNDDRAETEKESGGSEEEYGK
ncbi:transcriptional regulator, MarR family [Marvinbryantia formatexigens DSM 14469]|uniref:Transcriptional regulator, MarR family n=1 Tax=Marvinbryantia formatexigens DSM 14469 TaxID=478749 RepID=C6L991_9FIRM|nr:MarR family transcriptional regulator [Marvinbryantia formatexigens]EET62830.1 transcriptional regulator, MarR family [Marvinbryantia formatexigens DSM 14469]UWO23177.1 MarR family transcriptional regulator [Marvinbryantia formatexigens DSM 14469]SDG02453.1 DNA-binding transcriptional regulator, MarR family [Marvinbryantia formatexigens]